MDSPGGENVNCLAKLRQPVYLRDVAFLKAYGNACFKLVQCRSVRNKGVFEDRPHVQKNTVNETKLSSNISRARNRVREYGLCNPWDYFATMTINPKFFDSYDLKVFKKVLAQWIRDYNKKHGTHVKYLLVPEKHKSGAWHLHGFFMGLSLDDLAPFTLDMKIPEYIREKLKKGETVYFWPAYQDKFGWNIVEPIRDLAKASSYITKYVTKDLEASVTELGSHLYYCSQGLKRAQLLKKGSMAATIEPDFENDYCKVNWFSRDQHTAEELSLLICNPKDIVAEKEPNCNGDNSNGLGRILDRTEDTWQHIKNSAVLRPFFGPVRPFCRC